MAPTLLQNLGNGFRKCGISPFYVVFLLEPGITREKEKIEDSLKKFLSKKRDVVGNSILVKKKKITLIVAAG